MEEKGDHNELTSEIWEDIGNHSKPSKADVKSIYSHLKPVQPPVFKDHRTTKEKNLEALKALLSSKEVDPDQSMITIEFGGKKFDFFPASDCWYSYSKQQFGMGIENLIQKILKHLTPRDHQE